tara:strand:- start:253 stop:543 length:291 start_codon:yes stop_codon:yes gene_type:complete
MNIYEIYSKQLESNVQKLNTELRGLKKQKAIDNSRLLECVTEITTQITEEKFKDAWEYNRPTGSKFTEEAQDFFNQRYDEIEHLIITTLNLNVNKS